MRRKILLSLVVTAVGIVVVIILISGIAGTRHDRVKQRLMSVKIGMTHAEVLATVGRPRFVKSIPTGSDGNVEMWVFPHDPVVSEAPRCVFSSSNGTVIQVVIDEHHKIGGLDRQPGPPLAR